MLGFSSPRPDRCALRESEIEQKYALTDQVIYRGLCSTIFLGIERKTFLQVGIKVMLKSLFASEEERRAAVAEVALHRAIPPHPNVIRLLVAEDTPQAFVLVTPYTPHGDLWELMRYGQTYCEVQVRNCIAQMLSALHHIHSICDLIHGDIKPHNFLVFKVDGRVSIQLCDFGLAERPDTPGGTLTFKGLRGTSGWLPPEVLSSVNYGFAIDLFGCGLILYRMLGGYPPFDPPSNFSSGLHFDERYWCHVSPLCRDFIAMLLSLDPTERGTAHSCSEHPWFTSADSIEPSAEQLKQLSASGPLPLTNVVFCSASDIPAHEQRLSYADLASLAGTDCEMSDAE